MEIKISLPLQALKQWNESLEQKLQVAAVKAWETAVERTPAAMEGPYSTGFLRQSIRVQKTGDKEYTLISPAGHSMFLEFGTGPKGRASGAVPEFENDPQPGISYHTGEVFVTRHAGRLLDQPYIRLTQGMYAQPFIRPALLEGMRVLKELLSKP